MKLEVYVNLHEVTCSSRLERESSHIRKCRADHFNWCYAAYNLFNREFPQLLHRFRSGRSLSAILALDSRCLRQSGIE